MIVADSAYAHWNWCETPGFCGRYKISERVRARVRVRVQGQGLGSGFRVVGRVWGRVRGRGGV